MRYVFLCFAVLWILSPISFASDFAGSVAAVFFVGESATWVGAGFAVGSGEYVLVPADFTVERFSSAASALVNYPIVVSPHTGEYYRSEVIAKDEKLNLALLRLAEKALPGMPFVKREAFRKVPLVAEKLLLSNDDRSIRWPASIFGPTKSEKTPMDAEIREWRAEKAAASEQQGIKWLYLSGVTPREAAPKGSPVVKEGEGLVGMYFSRLQVDLIISGKTVPLDFAQCLPSFEITPFLQKCGIDETVIYGGSKAVAKPSDASKVSFQHIYRALSFMGSGNWKLAEESARAFVELQPSSAKAYMLLGTALAGLGNWNDALKAFDKALELDSKLPGLQFSRAEALFAIQKDKEAEAAYRKAIEESPKDIRPLLRLSKLLALNEAGRAEALSLAKKALSIEQNSPLARLTLGLRHRDLGNYDEAVAEIRRALSIVPGWGIARAELAATYALAGKNAEAEEQYRILLEDNPRSPAAILDLAAFLAKNGKNEEAAELLKKLEELKPPKQFEESITKVRELIEK